MPFCRHLCPYCDFAVAVRKSPPHDEYAEALVAEWIARRDELGERHVETLYFGGGTPGLWEVGAMRRFLDALFTDENVDPDSLVEQTIEVNPHNITRDRLDAWASMGFDRVSLGVQSFDDDYLARLGRDHDGNVATRAVELLLADGRFRASIDLIHSGPGYSGSVVEGDLRRLEALGPRHVSAYELTVEPNTVFARRAAAGDLELPGDDASWGAELVAGLAELGYDRYEVSSYGRDGEVGLHNARYWWGFDYLGLGVGAHSLRVADRAMRRNNPRSLRAYLAEPSRAEEREELSEAKHFGERLFLAVRTTRATNWENLVHDFGGLSEFVVRQVRTELEDLAEAQFVTDLPMVAATQRGLDFADWVGARLWEAATLEPTA